MRWKFRYLRWEINVEKLENSDLEIIHYFPEIMKYSHIYLSKIKKLYIVNIVEIVNLLLQILSITTVSTWSASKKITGFFRFREKFALIPRIRRRYRRRETVTLLTIVDVSFPRKKARNACKRHVHCLRWNLVFLRNTRWCYRVSRAPSTSITGYRRWILSLEVKYRFWLGCSLNMHI